MNLLSAGWLGGLSLPQEESSSSAARGAVRKVFKCFIRYAVSCLLMEKDLEASLHHTPLKVSHQRIPGNSFSSNEKVYEGRNCSEKNKCKCPYCLFGIANPFGGSYFINSCSYKNRS